MRSRLSLWMQEPVTKVLFKLLEDQRQQAYQTLLNTSDDTSLMRLRERLKIYHQILDVERLFEGELDEVDK